MELGVPYIAGLMALLMVCNMVIYSLLMTMIMAGLLLKSNFILQYLFLISVL